MGALILALEGEKKVNCAANDDFIAIGFGGVDCWQQGGAPLPDLDRIDWRDTDVVLFFDSDYKHNPRVRQAMNKLARELTRRGATVRLADPPDGPDGEKWGYDDCRKNLGIRKTKQLVFDAKIMDLPPDLIDDLNDRFYVAPEGSNVLIHDERDGTAYRLADFKLLFMSQYVECTDGKSRRLGDAWASDPHRRQYERSIFDPEAPENPRVYNRYKGFAFDAIPGNCSLYLRHIEENICGGNTEYADYLLNWMARGVQHPGLRGEVAIVLRGEQGTGKGVFANTYGALFAPHAYHASSAIEVTGRFSGHLKDKVFIFLDEAFYAGDKAHVGTLKKIITEPTIAIEKKHRDRVEEPNRLKIIMASNEHWVIPAGLSERRFFMLDVSATHKQQTKYFGRIIKQLQAGGYEALLCELLNRDISTFNHRYCPRTEALAEQQLYTMSPVESFWANLLDIGVFPNRYAGTNTFGNKENWGVALKKELYDDFIKQARNRGLSHLPDIAQFGRQLNQLLPPGYPKNSRPRIDGSRFTAWEFPSLEICLLNFEKLRKGGQGKK